MKLQVLVDNNTYIDAYYLAEPAVCYNIEIDGNKILFDTGYSDVFICNAEKMNIDLEKINYIVLSHGHNDHTGGLLHLNEKMDCSAVKLIAHPNCFLQKKMGKENIGAPFCEKQVKKYFDYCPQKSVFYLSENCIFLGEIAQSNDFELREEMGFFKKDGLWQPDIVQEDTALVCKTKQGLFIVTGCSHSGICNIIEYAKKVCQEEKIAGIIGGFHLFDVDKRLKKTIDYFLKNKITMLYPCHCVSFEAKAKIHELIKIKEVGVGCNIVLY